MCGAPRLSLFGAPTVLPSGEPQPIGADAPSLLCGAPSIMLCGELQPLGADMPILIRGAEAPCAKGVLNAGDAGSSIALPGSTAASMVCGAFWFSSSTRLMAEDVLLFVGMLGEGGYATGCTLLPRCVAPRLGLCAISLGGGK